MASYDDDLPVVVIERRTGAASPFLWGAMLGAAATLLFAPRSGTETRRELSDSLRRLRQSADEALHEVQGKVFEARGEVESRIAGARSAFGAGRDAARGAKNDLGRRYQQGRESARTSYRGATGSSTGGALGGGAAGGGAGRPDGTDSDDQE